MMTEKSQKIKTTIEVFTIKQPEREMEVIVDGKKQTQIVYSFHHFTTHDKPVSVGGIQYIPLSSFDQVRWDLIDNDKDTYEQDV